MAALALLAAGITAGVALKQRKVAAQPMAESQPLPSQFDWSSGTTNQEQIRLALQKLGSADQNDNRLRAIDELAAQIPVDQIPETLKASSLIPGDSERSRFQRQLLIKLATVDPLAAMTNAITIKGTTVNEAGTNGSTVSFPLVVLDKWIERDLPGAFAWVRQEGDAPLRQQALEKIVPALPADSFTNTLAQLNDLKTAPGERIYTLLFQRWATNDPVQAIEQRQQVPGGDANNNVLHAIVAVWADQQPEAALNWVKAQPDSDAKIAMLEACIQEQAKSDFSKALAIAEPLPDGPWRNGVIARLFNDWAAKDLAAASAACEQMPEGAAKEKAQECVLNRRIEADPASAAEAVKNLAPGEYREKAVVELCHHWSGTNAATALAWAQSLPSDAERVSALNIIVPNWARVDAPAASQFAGEHPELPDTALGAIAGAWLQTNYSAATNWVGTLPDGSKKDAALLAMANSAKTNAPEIAAGFCSMLTTSQPPTEVIQVISSSFAQQDVSAAVAWARSLKDNGSQETAISALAAAWANKDPKGLATYALSLPTSDARTQLLTLACRELATTDFTGMTALLQPLTDSGLRQNILEQAAGSIGVSKINSTATEIAAMPPGDDQKAAINGLLSNWAAADPESALNWLCSFSQTNSQPEQVQFVIQKWSASEPGAMAKWLSNAPAGTVNDEMVGAFLDSCTAKYPDFAAHWTESVSDDVKRQKFQTEVARQWMKSDPSAAAKWIGGLNLPEETKQLLKAASL